MKTSEEIQQLEAAFKTSLALLRDLADIQNGAPLVTVEKEWNAIMTSTCDFLEQHEAYEKKPKT
jgi:hypothetical protein